MSESVCWDGARINHYLVKSVEEFVLGKARRGSAATPIIKSSAITLCAMTVMMLSVMWPLGSRLRLNRR